MSSEQRETRALFLVRAMDSNGRQHRAVIRATSLADAREAMEDRHPGACVIAEPCAERPSAGISAKPVYYGSAAISRPLASTLN